MNCEKCPAPYQHQIRAAFVSANRLHDAEEWLAERLLERLAHLPVPAMLRALRGSAGPFVARAALEVLFTGCYDRLNPKLGDVLRLAFDARTIDPAGPRLRPPFVRLDAEIASLEIFCPAQDAAFVAPGRFGWRVNGRLQSWPSAADFVLNPGGAGRDSMRKTKSQAAVSGSEMRR